MASVSTICEELIKTVASCNLDYKMIQTPFSLNFSIRKKFNKSQDRVGIRSVQNQDITENFRSELFLLRSEYERLWNFYQTEVESKTKLEAKMKVLSEEIVSRDNLKHLADDEIKKLKLEMKTLEKKLENKCVEVKHMKAENDSIARNKNALDVAVKSARQETKEEKKRLSKEIETLEKKNYALEEFRKKKLSEEREEMIRIKKQVKKEAKKDKQNSKNNIKEKIQEMKKEANGNEKPVTKTELLQTKEVPNHNTGFEASEEPPGDIDQTCVENLLRTTDLKDTKVEAEENVDEDKNSEEGQVVNEEIDQFIGPKLPRRMTQEEIDAFYAEVMASCNTVISQLGKTG